MACGIIARSAGLFQNPKQICSCDGLTIWEERSRPIAGEGRKEPAQPPPTSEHSLSLSLSTLPSAVHFQREALLAQCQET